MRIRELLSNQSIALGAEAANKKDIIEKMTVLMETSGNLTDRKRYLKGVLECEAEGTTGIGEGVAIPHAKNAAVKKAGIAAMVLKKEVDFESLDGEPVKLVFMIAAPDNGANEHLEALSRLSTMLMDDEFRNRLIQAEDRNRFLAIIDEKEQKLDEKSSEKAEMSISYKVLAITACPTGIAHTFMAAESLEMKGKELGIPVKVETQGADGAKNVLKAEEIKAADGIIIAADKNVDLARFDGKKVLITKVADGIHKPEELIRKIENGNAPIYHHDGQKEQKQPEVKESLGRKIYKDLMNGVSNMLPFVIGGGILIAIAFLLDDYSIDPSNFGKNTPIAAYFKTIGEFAFGMMLPVLSGFIAMSIADRPGLAVGFVAGLVAKAGSTFLNPAEGNFEIMASVMAGGMVPPLAIAFCTTFFKNRFTKKERESGLVNYLLGLSFISEGAIPFAASDPLRVIPSCIVGSAVAGGLSMFFECTLRAPHGGVFVLPTIGHPMMYVLSILIGSLVGCAILGILKRPLKGEQ